MTVPGWLLLDVALAEAVLLLLAWLVFLGHGARSGLKRRREPRLAAARDALIDGLLTGSLSDKARARIERLRRSELVELFQRVAPNLRGQEREWLGALASELGLVRHGQKLCGSRRWWRRLRGARLLTLAGGAEEQVFALADDPNPIVRGQVAEWCGAHPSERSVATLIGMLGDTSQAGRFAVQDALTRIGGLSIEPLAEALTEARSENAILAGLTVARGLGDGRLTPAVLPLANHPSARVRAAACRALGASGGHAVGERLEAALEDDDARVRATAARALGEVAHWPAGPKLVAVLSDRSWDARLAAGRALARIGPPGELLLRKAMRSENLFVADMARHAMDTASVVTRFEPV